MTEELKKGDEVLVTASTWINRKAVTVGESQKKPAWRVRWLDWRGSGRPRGHGMTVVGVWKGFCKPVLRKESYE